MGTTGKKRTAQASAKAFGIADVVYGDDAGRDLFVELADAANGADARAELAKKILEAMDREYGRYAAAQDYPPDGTLERLAKEHGWTA